MTYLVVHATEERYLYVTASSYQDALATYLDWLGSYAKATHDRFARRQVTSLREAGEASRGRVVEYRSHSYHASGPQSSRAGQVFVLSQLEWPNIWRVPPDDLPRDWGETIEHLDYQDGAFELRTKFGDWLIVWLDGHGSGFTMTDKFGVAAEAMVQFAFIEAYVKAPPEA